MEQISPCLRSYNNILNKLTFLIFWIKHGSNAETYDFSLKDERSLSNLLFLQQIVTKIGLTVNFNILCLISPQLTIVSPTLSTSYSIF